MIVGLLKAVLKKLTSFGIKLTINSSIASNIKHRVHRYKYRDVRNRYRAGKYRVGVYRVGRYRIAGIPSSWTGSEWDLAQCIMPITGDAN